MAVLDAVIHALVFSTIASALGPAMATCMVSRTASLHRGGADAYAHKKKDMLFLLGNAECQKKSYAHARSIMVMHSNESGECGPRTLVDRKRKRYDNVVDVVVRLHDRPILVPNIRTSVICTCSTR